MRLKFRVRFMPNRLLAGVYLRCEDIHREIEFSDTNSKTLNAFICGTGVLSLIEPELQQKQGDPLWAAFGLQENSMPVQATTLA